MPVTSALDGGLCGALHDSANADWMLNDELANNRETRLKVKLETIDGRIIEVDPPVWIYITDREGQERLFCSPLRTTFDRGFMYIKHNCGPPARIAANEVLKVQVEER